MATERFTKDHEWIRVDGGIGHGRHHRSRARTSWATSCSSRCPRSAARPRQGEAVAVVESVKAASDVFAPVVRRGHRGQRRASPASPALVNEDAEGKAWFLY